jgi:hypothetical protein
MMEQPTVTLSKIVDSAVECSTASLAGRRPTKSRKHIRTGLFGFSFSTLDAQTANRCSLFRLFSFLP